jgi:hypothetical protein
MPLFGPPHIARPAAKGDVGGSIKALRYTKDPVVRTLAALMLDPIGDARGRATPRRRPEG